jgi:acetolactate synthase I/II/III large subunit
MNMRVSEYIANRLVELGVRHVFMLTGGGSMFLNYAFGKHPQIKTIFNHHEQASAIAAEGYARIMGSPGVLNVTTGPGAINALNGVHGAFTDSIPMLVISGQVKRETYIRSYNLPELRQLGDQEVDIASMAKGITKYVATVTDAQTIRYHLEKAWHLCLTGRPGPCWLDIPIDVQSMSVDETKLQGFVSLFDSDPVSAQLRESVTHTLSLLKKANRPVILAGSGVRISGQVKEFLDIVHKLGIPVTTAWTHDIIASDDPVYCGRPGTIGTRGGNFAVQNSDILLILGSRLNIRQIGYAWKSFARSAYKIWVDVDAAELNKPTVKPDMPIHANLRDFFNEARAQLNEWDSHQHSQWLAWCRERNMKYPAVLSKHREFHGKINPYHFMDVLFENLDSDDIIVTGNASACIISFQAGKIKLGQRLFSNSGAASMGYDLPASIGAAIAADGKRIICLAGDGSLQLNIQELQTVAQHQLPIKIFVLNNGGYLSIRASQRAFFGGVVGESAESGVMFPDAVKVAEAYGLPALRLASADFEQKIPEVLGKCGPILCEVMLDPSQGFEPRQSSRQLPDGRITSAPLEDMFPFLDRDELLSNMHIPLWQE